MPIYEYKCTNCKHVFEEFVAIGTIMYKCPECNCDAVKSSGSYLTVSPGLPNGHTACRATKTQ